MVSEIYCMCITCKEEFSNPLSSPLLTWHKFPREYSDSPLLIFTYQTLFFNMLSIQWGCIGSTLNIPQMYMESIKSWACLSIVAE